MFLLDGNLSCRVHIQYVAKRLKVLRGFYHRSRSFFSFHVKKRLVESTFLPVLNYADIFSINVAGQSLHMLDSAYRGALRFITDCGFLTHNCTLF